jgi:hypothetical protein
MILVFTSVKEDRPWYKRDILNVCCEREGAQIQFAYKNEWIPDDIRNQLDGKGALIVYCERKESEAKSGVSTGYFTFHPVRAAKITKATPEFATTTISLRLGNFFDYESDAVRIPAMIDGFQQYIIKAADNPNNKSAARFVRQESPWDKARFCNSWMPLVQHFGNLEGLDDSLFFCAQQRGKFGGPPYQLFPAPNDQESRTVYALRSGAEYELSLQIVAGAKAKYQDPAVTVKESLAAVTGPFVRQRSAGLQADFIVQCKRSFQEETGMLSIAVPPVTPSTFRSPQMNVLINLSVRRWLLIAAVSLLTVGSFFVSTTPDAVNELASFVSGSRYNWTSDHKDWISNVIKLIGLCMLAGGSWIGFRKLPSKAD